MTISVFLFLLIVFFMVFFLIRYRRSRNPHPGEFSGNRLMETLWVVVPTILVLTMFVYGLTGFTFLRRAPADSFHIKVISKQWSWIFEYDTGKRSAQLVVPVGRNVRVELVSQDVIHSFFVPAFRIKQDTVPGMTTYAWFNATQTGTYVILCAEYCGVAHSLMRAKLVVMTPELFDAWYGGG
jgi:cytochrome c oxidase subunit 2